MNQVYVSTVQLLLVVVPVLFESKFFALKDGTALNLFVQDLPRLLGAPAWHLLPFAPLIDEQVFLLR